jgi:hypothetical protein
LDAQPKLEYVVAMAKNAVLKRVAENGMRRARQLSRRRGVTEHIYGEVRYKAGKWPGQRRVIIKAEVVRVPDKDPRDNPRFVITNMKQSPQWIYEHVYCQRGDIENRIKELHDLEIDRTSCTSFWANQFRVLPTAAAYVLIAGVALAGCRYRLRPRSSWNVARTTAEASARVLVSVRRVVVHLPASFPFLPAFRCVALALGAANRLASGSNHELKQKHLPLATVAATPVSSCLFGLASVPQEPRTPLSLRPINQVTDYHPLSFATFGLRRAS